MVPDGPADLTAWQLIRRYAVPGWMIAECTRARERGDWRAACEAARVDVAIPDPRPVEDLLAGFAPDLLLWHLPRSRNGSASLAPRTRYLLAPDGPVDADTVVLEVRSPAWTGGPQRLLLRAVRMGDLEPGTVFPVPRCLWDARRASELRATEPVTPPAADLACVDTWAAAGWLTDVTEADPRSWSGESDLLAVADPALTAREMHRMTAQFGRHRWKLRASRPGPDYLYACYLQLEAAPEGDRIVLSQPRQRQHPSAGVDLCLHAGLLRAPIDQELIQRGRLAVTRLHPLVRAALYPSRRPTPTVEEPAAERADHRRDRAERAVDMTERFRVNCGGEWHWITLHRGSRLELPHHTDAERQRELTLSALGGRLNGCFQAERAWRDGEGRLPRRLAAHRRDLWRRMAHGGSRVVLAFLDAGLDPHIRDGQGLTLLHRLHQFDHAELLPRLLAEGLDVNARSRRGWTPMIEALAQGASPALLLALNKAGAFPPLSLSDPATWPIPRLSVPDPAR